VTAVSLTVGCDHGARLCFAMQQCAVPWLRGIRLENVGPAAVHSLQLTVTLEPGFAAPLVRHVAEIPAGGRVDLAGLDLQLDGSTIANLDERQVAQLRVVVAHAEVPLAEFRGAVEVLAWNEWPGLEPLPELLAAFVTPNHPVLDEVLVDVAARLMRATGDGALDGARAGQPGRALAILAAVHDAVVARGITYVTPPPSFESSGQKVRTAEQVLAGRLATCLDLALTYAALLEHAGLHPVLVLLQGHAFVGVALHPPAAPFSALSAVELRKRCDAAAFAVVECTLACVDSARTFDVARAAARRHFDDDAAVVATIDVVAARRAGIRPLPSRTVAFTPVPREVVLPAPVAAPAVPAPAASLAPTPSLAPPPPLDRLEHWKSKLLDLSMWNRLLNFVETKKTVPLAAHDLAELASRFQSGARFRVHPRAPLGRDGVDPRDLEIERRRTGIDVRATFLAEELRAGRLRAELDDDQLAVRLVEVFRHARTSIEESGANTLYLAIGFLRWFETPQSPKPRRAPLLLLPVQIERLSVQEGFRLVIDDAEPRVNQSLLQMLLRDHDVRIAVPEPLPETDDGIAVESVLDAFRAAVLSLPRWEVEPTACLGFFSFSKYLMWLDLADRDELLRSPVLHHLVTAPGTPFVQDVPELPRDETDDVDPAEVFCPKDADSSQLAAVLAGAAGRTFVLEGPPGTGKSQTITNLIAQSLANGKRVLFVAEKRAALEVVQRRLDDVGLGPFCLELHSSKSGPKAVLAQLRRALDVGRRRHPEEWERLAASLQQERHRLNAFVRSLHRPREHGASVFAAMTELVGLSAARAIPLPELPCDQPAPVAAAHAAVDSLATVAAGLGVPEQEAWWGARLREWTPALAREIPPLAQRVLDAAVGLAAALAPVANAFGLERVFGAEGPSAAQLPLLLQLGTHFLAPSVPPAALLLADWRTVAPALTDLVAIGTRRTNEWNTLAPRWRPELLSLDCEALAAVHRDAVPSFFLRRWLRLRGPRAQLRAVAVGALRAPAETLADLEVAVRVREADRQIAAATAIAPLLGADWRREQSEWARIAGWIPWIEAVRRLLVRIEPGALQPSPALLASLATQLDGITNGSHALGERLGALQSAHAEFAAALRAVSAPLHLDPAAAFGGDAAPGHVRRVEARARRWLGSVPRLRDHAAYEREAQAATARALGPIVAAHARGDVRTDDLRAVLRRTFLEAWLDGVHRAEPELARFRGQEHEAAIAKFAAMDQRAIRLAADVVLARLAAQLPQVRDTQVASSELGVLERELKKQRRHKPVRRLLAEIPGLLQRLAPCVLMSPLSVAQFLGRAGTRFDLVVFDEASQIPVWDAVGALGRGTSAIVVGDSRQLPPTSFFQRLQQGDDDPLPDELPEDLESVLDECSAAGLPRSFLAWHYRSRHESLIAFSNRNYYENRLLTFPSPVRDAADVGVRFVRVDGVYDRAASQQNRREAEALVAEVKARLLDPTRAKHSLGIVTFSQAQQVLIEDLLDRVRAEHPEVEPWFGAAAEPVFVKNLENVQGDERDTILFSICYGPDAAGRVHENYGPLNQQGGERRLNVAITRARRELVVFASLRADQVANRTESLGARHLRAFLDYAERGPAALAAVTAADPSGAVDSPFEAMVCAALRARGHEVHTQIGCSGYRIDLAVVDPSAPGRYLLGIECDGAAYHSAATARDRDRLRASVLQGLGWTLHRVWSTDYWQDPQGELERIEAALAAARASAPPPAAPPRVAAPPPPAPVASAAPIAATPAASPAAPDDPDGPRPYRAIALGRHGDPDAFAAARSLSTLRDRVVAILEVEAPIAFDRLARTLASAWGVQRLTDRVRERVRAALPPTAVEADGVVWASPEHRTAFRGFRTATGDEETTRDADELPAIEIENAMLWLLRQHEALAAADLARETARCFGISRLGTVVREVMEAALGRLVTENRCALDGDLLRRS